MNTLVGIITSRRQRVRRCRDCGHPITPRGRCTECGVPVTPAIPPSLGPRTRLFALTAATTALLGFAVILLVGDAWTTIPAGSMFSTPRSLLTALFLVAFSFSLFGFLCQFQLVRCRRAMGIRHRRPWADPLLPLLLVIPVLSIASVGAVFTLTGHLPMRIAPQLLVIERLSLLMMIGCQVAVVILLGRLLAELVGIFNSIDRDWWRRRAG